jgi:MFS transporter, MHS family, proline/betaine transporter
MMEWYDFAVYAYFASVISDVFFPGKSSALLYTFATFGVGFVMRPLGGIVFGYFGDKVGRRSTLTWSVMLMAIATFAMGLIPSYAEIGTWAPVLLVVFRLVQGFSVGGEYAGSTSFMVEYANPRRRGLIGSMQSVSVFVSLLVGSGAGTLITSVLSKEAVHSYGWRIPFLVGVLLGVAGLYFRLKIEDTPLFRELKETRGVSSAPLKDVGRNEFRAMGRVLGLSTFFTVAFYLLLTYLPTYLSKELGMALPTSLAVTSVGIAWATVLAPIAGALSDRVGRKPLLAVSAASFIVFTYPLFMMMTAGSTALIIIAILILMVPLSLLYGTAPTTFTELFPTNVRYSGFSVPYNIATAAFGGFAPFIATLLIKVTGDQLSPTFYLIAAAIVGLLTVLTFRETAKQALR